jgi:hypothetical protein
MAAENLYLVGLIHLAKMCNTVICLKIDVIHYAEQNLLIPHVIIH